MEFMQTDIDHKSSVMLSSEQDCLLMRQQYDDLKKKNELKSVESVAVDRLIRGEHSGQVEIVEVLNGKKSVCQSVIATKQEDPSISELLLTEPQKVEEITQKIIFCIDRGSTMVDQLTEKFLKFKNSENEVADKDDKEDAVFSMSSIAKESLQSVALYLRAGAAEVRSKSVSKSVEMESLARSLDEVDEIISNLSSDGELQLTLISSALEKYIELKEDFTSVGSLGHNLNEHNKQFIAQFSNKLDIEREEMNIEMNSLLSKYQQSVTKIKDISSELGIVTEKYASLQDESRIQINLLKKNLKDSDHHRESLVNLLSEKNSEVEHAVETIHLLRQKLQEEKQIQQQSFMVHTDVGPNNQHELFSTQLYLECSPVPLERRNGELFEGRQEQEEEMQLHTRLDNFSGGFNHQREQSEELMQLKDLLEDNKTALHREITMVGALQDEQQRRDLEYRVVSSELVLMKQLLLGATNQLDKIREFIQINQSESMVHIEVEEVVDENIAMELERLFKSVKGFKTMSVIYPGSHCSQKKEQTGDDETKVDCELVSGGGSRSASVSILCDEEFVKEDSTLEKSTNKQIMSPSSTPVRRQAAWSRIEDVKEIRFQETVQELSSKIISMDSIIQDFSSRLDAAQLIAQVQKAAIEEQETVYQQKVFEVNQLMLITEEKTNELTTTQEYLSQVGAREFKYQADVHQLNLRLSGKMEEIFTLQTQLSELSQKFQVIIEANSEESTRAMKELNEDITLKDNEIERASNRILDLERAVGVSHGQLTSDVGTVSNARDDTIDDDEDHEFYLLLEELMEIHGHLSNEIKAVRSTSVTKSVEMSNRVEVLDRVRTRLHTARADHHAKCEECATQQMRIEALLHQRSRVQANLQETTHKLDNCRNEYQAQVATLGSQLASAQVDLSTMRTEYELKRDEASAACEDRESLQTYAADLQTELEETNNLFKKKVQWMHVENAKLEEDLTSAKEDLAQLQELYDNLIGENMKKGIRTTAKKSHSCVPTAVGTPFSTSTQLVKELRTKFDSLSKFSLSSDRIEREIIVSNLLTPGRDRNLLQDLTAAKIEKTILKVVGEKSVKNVESSLNFLSLSTLTIPPKDLVIQSSPKSAIRPINGPVNVTAHISEMLHPIEEARSRVLYSKSVAEELQLKLAASQEKFASARAVRDQAAVSLNVAVENLSAKQIELSTLQRDNLESATETDGKPCIDGSNSNLEELRVVVNDLTREVNELKSLVNTQSAVAVLAVKEVDDLRTRLVAASQEIDDSTVSLARIISKEASITATIDHELRTRLQAIGEETKREHGRLNSLPGVKQSHDLSVRLDTLTEQLEDQAEVILSLKSREQQVISWNRELARRCDEYRSDLHTKQSTWLEEISNLRASLSNLELDAVDSASYPAVDAELSTSSVKLQLQVVFSKLKSIEKAMQPVHQTEELDSASTSGEGIQGVYSTTPVKSMQDTLDNLRNSFGALVTSETVAEVESHCREVCSALLMPAVEANAAQQTLSHLAPVLVAMAVLRHRTPVNHHKMSNTKITPLVASQLEEMELKKKTPLSLDLPSLTWSSSSTSPSARCEIGQEMEDGGQTQTHSVGVERKLEFDL